MAGPDKRRLPTMKITRSFLFSAPRKKSPVRRQEGNRTGREEEGCIQEISSFRDARLMVFQYDVAASLGLASPSCHSRDAFPAVP